MTVRSTLTYQTEPVGVDPECRALLQTGSRSRLPVRWVQVVAQRPTGYAGPLDVPPVIAVAVLLRATEDLNRRAFRHHGQNGVIVSWPRSEVEPVTVGPGDHGCSAHWEVARCLHRCRCNDRQKNGNDRNASDEKPHSFAYSFRFRVRTRPPMVVPNLAGQFVESKPGKPRLSLRIYLLSRISR